MPDKPDPAYLQWKAYFSMNVLGQTDPIYNPTTHLDEWWLHQSCPWSAIVSNFEHKNEEFCRDCGNLSQDGYCDRCDYECYDCGEKGCEGYCEGDKCGGCGEVGCGAYMCKPCRADFSCY